MSNASARGTIFERFRSPGDVEACLGCGYDLRATAAGVLCPECACDPSCRSDAPMLRWLDHVHSKHILLALRLGTMGLFLFGFGSVLLSGLATFAIMSELARSIAGYAFVVMGVVLVCWGGYLVLGFASAAVLLRVGRTSREPTSMREQRDLVVYICLVAPLAWLVCALVGSLLLRLSDFFAVFIIPMNALLIGGPALAVHHWAISMHAALTTRRDERRALSRRRTVITWAYIVWVLLALAGSVVIASVAMNAHPPTSDFTTERRIIGGIFLFGGFSFGVLMLAIGRGVWAMRCRLRSVLPKPVATESRAANRTLPASFVTK